MGDGPSLFSQIFTERSAVLTLFAALGGVVRAATLRTTWVEGLRVVIIGSATAFGIGEGLPWILSKFIGDFPESFLTSPGAIGSMGFITGLLSVVLVEWLIAGGKMPKGKADDQEKT